MFLKTLEQIVSTVMDLYELRGFMVGDEWGPVVKYWIDPNSENFRFTNLLDLTMIA